MLERVELAFGCGGEELFEGCEVGDVAFEAIDRAFGGVVVEVALLEDVGTWAEEARAEAEVEEDVAL